MCVCLSLTVAVDRTTAAALSDAIADASRAVFHKGALLGHPVTGVRLSLVPSLCRFDDDTTPTALRAAVSAGVLAALKKAEPTLLEPVMSVEVRFGVVAGESLVGNFCVPCLQLQLPQESVGTIANQLTSHQRGTVQHIASMPTGSRSMVSALVPLTEMIGACSEGFAVAGLLSAGVDVNVWCAGYSTALRSKTGGEGSFSMEFHSYQPVGPLEQQQLLSNPI